MFLARAVLNNPRAMLVPDDGLEVLIKVEAAGLNFPDVLRRQGDAYPEHLLCRSYSDVDGLVDLEGPEHPRPSPNFVS